MKMVECRDRCSRDCKRVGFSCREEPPKCLTVPVLDTLSRVDNSWHLLFSRSPSRQLPDYLMWLSDIEIFIIKKIDEVVGWHVVAWVRFDYSMLTMLSFQTSINASWIFLINYHM